MVAQVAEEVHYPDGRVGLASTDEIAGSGYANGDLAPLPIERRTWTTYNYTALWIGMSHCIPTYLPASGLILVGMNWVQALVTIGLANLIVLVPMLLNSHAGTKYGIPYPVFARASFGLRGANLPAVLRALIACAWFGIQTWIGGEGFYTLIGAVAGDGWSRARPCLVGHPGRRGRRARLARRQPVLRRLPVDPVAVLRHLLGAGDGHHRPRHEHPAPVRELGRSAGPGGRDRAARLHRDQGPRLRLGAVPAGQAGLGRPFLAGVLPLADGHDRVLVDDVAEHAGLHPVQPRPETAAVGPGAGPADHDDVLLAAGRVHHRGFGEDLRRPDLGSDPAHRQVQQPGGRRLRAVHHHRGHPERERGRQHGQPVLRLLQPGAQAGQLPYRRHHHRRDRRPHPALAAADQPACVHLRLAGLLRGTARRGGGGADRRLLADPQHGAPAGRPLPSPRRLLVQRGLELARGGRVRGRRAPGGGRSLVRSRPGPVPGTWPDPG